MQPGDVQPCGKPNRHDPHGICPGVPLRAERLERGALKLWRNEGVTLLSTNEAGPRIHGGVVDLDELAEFVGYVRQQMPDALVVVHADGLRAIRSEGIDGPVHEWRDWD